MSAPISFQRPIRSGPTAEGGLTALALLRSMSEPSPETPRTVALAPQARRASPDADDASDLALLLDRAALSQGQRVRMAEEILHWARCPVLRFDALPSGHRAALAASGDRGRAILNAHAARHVPGGVTHLHLGATLNDLLVRPTLECELDEAAPLRELHGFPDATNISLTLPPSDDDDTSCDLRDIDPARVPGMHVEVALPPCPGQWLIEAPKGVRIKVRSTDPREQHVTARAWVAGRMEGIMDLAVNQAYCLDLPPEPPPFMLTPSRANSSP